MTVDKQSVEMPIAETPKLTMGRRAFLTGLLATGATTALGAWEQSDRDKDASVSRHIPESISAHNPLETPVRQLDQRLHTETDYNDTTLEGLGVYAGLRALSAVTNNDIVQAWTGNSGGTKVEEGFETNPVKEGLLTCVVAPIAEEAIFRYLPVRQQDGKLHPVRGIISTYIFGKLHQFYEYERERPALPTVREAIMPDLAYNRHRIPVQQYVGGALYWMLARRRGVSHAMTAHATVNTLASADILLNNARKKRQS